MNLVAALSGTLRVRDAVQQRWWAAVGGAWLRGRGVVLDGQVHLQGLPIVSMAPGSSIRLGRASVLCSHPRYTALGVARPVVLRTLRSGASITLGQNCGLSGTVICAALAVIIGDECLFGADVQVVDTDFHPIKPEGRRHNNRAEDIASAPVTIGRNVFIGARSIVLKGVSIGDDVVIGAGSVVTKSIPAGMIAAGNPARVIGPVSQLQQGVTP
jgi:acetyltransferase-like isoleucine patch superfamily enzyme